MKNRKGFTLIELLAIIVILAIIAVITVPIILNIIDNSKEGAIADSAYGYKDAIQNYYVSMISDPENVNVVLDGSYTIDSNGNLVGDRNLAISASGDLPDSGKVIISNNTISGCFVYDEYYALMVNGEVTRSGKGACPSDKYIAFDSNYNSIETETFDDSWEYYIYEDGITGAKQLCGSFVNGDVCFDLAKWDGLTGSYVSGKKAEYEAAIGDSDFSTGHDTACWSASWNGNDSLNCGSSTVNCYMNSNGTGTCRYQRYGCTAEANGTYYCGE